MCVCMTITPQTVIETLPLGLQYLLLTPTSTCEFSSKLWYMYFKHMYDKQTYSPYSAQIELF